MLIMPGGIITSGVRPTTPQGHATNCCGENDYREQYTFALRANLQQVQSDVEYCFKNELVNIEILA